MLGYLYRQSDTKVFIYLENRKDIVLDRPTTPIQNGVYVYDPKENRIVEQVSVSIDDFIARVDFSYWQPMFNISNDMKQHMLEFAKKILRYKLENRFLILRSHNDADGFGAAVGISKIFPYAMKIIYPNPNYQIKDAISDISILLNKSNSALILTDLGGNVESLQALNLLKVHGIEFLVIDHHPFQNPNRDRFLISWEYDNTGKYTATYLTHEIARILGYDTDEFLHIGLVGDKSSLVEPTEELKMKSIVLDFLTSFTSDYNFIYTVMSNPHLYREYEISAREKYMEIANLIDRHSYVQIGKIKVYFIDAEPIIKRIEFQSTGKIASYILENAGEDSVVVVHNNSRYTIRIGEGAFRLGIDTHKIMNSISDMIAGGGHLKAASFRFHSTNRKIIQHRILNSIKKVLENR
ncbi:MAG: hypothetical protein NZ908_02570 [Candidatus Micrarchaeota archaeon]|nr:hypothetical protein [Candidatus Micrarchaeota archaeon]